nr:hypothetical protein [uncultured Olsenella sp.]
MLPGTNWKEPWKPVEGSSWWSEMLEEDRRQIESSRAKFQEERPIRSRRLPLPLWARLLVVARWFIWAIVVVVLACVVIELMSLT